MARITPQQRQRYGPLITGSVPGEVLKAIDDRELEDRLAQASGLMRQAGQAATPGAGRRSGEEARRILGARPRAVTEQIVVAKMAKAKALGTSPQAAYLERQAREELLLDPPAVRRFDPAAVIRKAKADGQLMACFDDAGKLWGVCDPDDVQAVEGHEGDGAPPAANASAAPAQPPAGSPGGALQGDGSQVAKAKGNAGMKAVFDQQGRLLGIIDPDDVTPVTTTLPGATEAVARLMEVCRRAQRTPVAKAVPAGHVAVYDQQGRFAGYVRPGDLTDPASEQARNRGPVNAGGTTGLGRPRQAGPSAGEAADSTGSFKQPFRHLDSSRLSSYY